MTPSFTRHFSDVGAAARVPMCSTSARGPEAFGWTLDGSPCASFRRHRKVTSAAPRPSSFHRPATREPASGRCRLAVRTMAMKTRAIRAPGVRGRCGQGRRTLPLRCEPGEADLAKPRRSTTSAAVPLLHAHCADEPRDRTSPNPSARRSKPPGTAEGDPRRCHPRARLALGRRSRSAARPHPSCRQDSNGSASTRQAAEAPVMMATASDIECESGVTVATRRPRR